MIECAANGQSTALARQHPKVKHLNLRFVPGQIRPGGPVDDPAAARSLRSRGYQTRHRRARKVTAESIATSQVVLATDHATLRSLQRRCTSVHAHKLHLLLDFVPGHAGQDLPQPMHGALEEYGQMLDLCEQAIQGLSHALITGGSRPLFPRDSGHIPANVG
jgi:protein-tyrosine-phosphatase